MEGAGIQAMRIPYAARLDALGLYLERAEATDILINELDGGFLVGYVKDDGQYIATLDEAEMNRLQDETTRPKGRSWTGILTTGSLNRRGDMRVRLHALGTYLDQRVAHDVMIQERAHGFSVEFTTLPQGAGDRTGLVRLHETLDDYTLRSPK